MNTFADPPAARPAAKTGEAVAASPPAPDARPWGLALSGGGIRSATFCFGVVVALARHGALLRFGLLSTVSGGGFIGALLGKLFHHAGGTPDGGQRVQAALAQADQRWFTWWLRTNGNYLFARGLRDIFGAAAVMLRNLIALHIELALLALVLASALALLNLGVWWGADQLWDPTIGAGQGGPLQRVLRRLPTWMPTLWLVLPALALAAGACLCAYWAMPRQPGRDAVIGGLLAWTSAVVSAACLVVFRQDLVSTGAGGLGLSRTLVAAALAMAVIWVLGIPLAWWLRLRAEGSPDLAEDRVRNRITRWLGGLLRLSVLLAGIGLLDRLAWFMAFELQALISSGALLLLLAALLRVVLPALGGSSGAAPAWLGSRLVTLAHLAGLLLTLVLAAWWMALAYRLIFEPVFPVGALEPGFGVGTLVALLFGGGAMLFLLATGHDVGFANLSSLHRFYRSRLVRGWLGASNAQRFPLGGVGPAAPQAHGLNIRHEEPVAGYTLRAEVDEVHPHDDLPLREYDPQRGGGPRHLINVCLNHTVRGKGPFNADRKGQGLTLAPGGLMRIGARPWEPIAPDVDAMTLGSWTAISGAAFSPGLGSMTRSGIAALAMFAGVRLGFWWDQVRLRDGGKPWPLLIKSRLLLNELVGRFRGDQGRFWFLSDGGHFENTGAYALLRERARLIVLADCGADPQYRFADLENLVRKARVDLGAAIRFLKPDPVFAAGIWRRFGSVGDLASSSSDACMALAEVTYRDAPDDPADKDSDAAARADRNRGWLVLLKPNMFAGLPVDLINFRNANPAFPQQATTDQRFDEAQWESYFMLGRAIGAPLDAGLLERIADGEALGNFKPDDGRMLASSALPGRVSAGLRERLTSGAVGASIGLTTAVTLGVSAWQAIDAWRSASARANEADDKALKELTDLWGRLRPLAAAPVPAAASATAGPPASAATSSAMPTPADTVARAANAGALAASLLRIGDTLCPAGFDRWFKVAPGASPSTAWLVLRDARQACDDLRLDAPQSLPQACSQLLRISNKENCLYPDDQASRRADEAFSHCPPRYWGRDYALGAQVGNCVRQERATRLDHDVVSGSAAEKAGPPILPATGVGGRVPDAAPSDAMTRPMPAPAAPLPTTASPKAIGAPVALPGAATSTRTDVTESTADSSGRLARCADRTVYVQIYGHGRDQHERAVRHALAAAGARVPLSEDVRARAAMAGRPLPTPVRRDTLRWHTAADEACARLLGAWLDSLPGAVTPARVEALPGHLRPTPHVVELWLAPGVRP